MGVLLLFFICIFVNCNALSRSYPEVNTKLGVIRGLYSEDGGVSKFLGVPYALVDETNPFGPAIPHPGFTEPYEAYSDEVFCPHAMNDISYGEIQCLQLHIYVPNTATANKTVMVWIHGGGWVEGNGGSTEFAPKYLVDKDILFVSINYRVGIYGFLCLDTPEFPGNQGLKDQRLALKWVKDNIADFGGDPDKITLFGTSAGAMSVGVHLINNDEKLFKQVIIQSGPVLTTRMIVDSNRTIPITMAKVLGHDTDDLDEAMAFLATQDHQLVALRTRQVFPSQRLIRPCVEKIFEGVDNYIIDYPLNIKSDLVKSIPVMIGYNDNEFAFQYGFETPEFFEEYSFEELLEYGMHPLNDSVVRILKNFYIGDEPVSYDVRTEITDFGSDFCFIYPTERMIASLIAQGAEDIYYYVFSYDGDRNYLKIALNLEVEGASHGDELGYLFDMEMFRDAKNERDMLMVERMTTLWTNFAKYGTPTPSVTELLPVTWPTVTEKTRPYLDLGSELVVKSRPFNRRFAFWDLFYKVNEKYQYGYGYVPQYGETKDDGNHSINLSGSVFIILTLLSITLIAK